jgi:hypothetical protein
MGHTLGIAFTTPESRLARGGSNNLQFRDVQDSIALDTGDFVPPWKAKSASMKEKRHATV